MTKTRKKSKLFFGMLFALVMGVVTTSIMPLTFNQSTFAEVVEVTTLTNLTFDYNNNTSSIYENPTGWKKSLNSQTTSGAIYTKKIISDYNLSADQNPGLPYEDADDHVLMINAKNEYDSLPKQEYYTNNSSLELDAYTNYRIKVWVKVLSGSTASVYISGLESDWGFENINYSQAGNWQQYTFYISTGLEKQSIKTELYLGNNSNGSSTGAVFFDNIQIDKVPENTIPDSESSYVKIKNYNESSLIANINANFESKDLSAWSLVNQLDSNAFAKVIDLSDSNDSSHNGIPYLKTDLSKNNSKALALYTTDTEVTNIALKSSDLNLGINDIVKISVNAKTANLNGKAYITLSENDVKNFSGDVIKSITPKEETIEITGNTSNVLTNDYSTYTFYVRARSLYNSTYNLTLKLGTEESKASGVVLFDNIKIENISYSDFTNASTDSNTKKLELQDSDGDFGIKNATFNDSQKQEKDLTYPLQPSNWEHTTLNDEDVYFGVINTNDSIYDAIKSQFGNFSNPGNHENAGNTSTDSNNILVMHNKKATYQTLKSSSFEVANDSYYKLNFSYNLIQTDVQTELLNVYLLDEENNVLYADENIAQNGSWQNYTIYVNTQTYTNTLYLKLSLGTENNLVKGLLYLDNVTITKQDSMTEETYIELAETNNTLDFEVGNFNLYKETESGVNTPLRYKSSLTNTNGSNNGLPAAFGGIISSVNNSDDYEIENSPYKTGALHNLMVISSVDKSTYTLTALDSIKLTGTEETPNYYKFTVDIKTQGISENSDIKETFGASFALSGLEQKFNGVISNDWSTYSILVCCTADTSVSLQFGLDTVDNTTAGNAFFDNFTFEKIEKEDYNTAILNSESDPSFLFIGNTDVAEEDDDTDSSQTSASSEAIWYVASTLILAVALILSVVVYFMKKIKIQKWQKKKISEYDRDKTSHREAIRVEAEKRRDADIKAVQSQIKDIEETMAKLEEEHQEALKQQRQDRSKGITSSAEKEFKQYAKKHTVLENRIAGLRNQIESMNSAEYLLSLQHDIAVEKVKQERLNKENSYSKKKK